ncbi:hypothetical protein PENSPDRAFT_683902 [Peniophora sp. CONT]|nr:hypothetical protein PENSPDRAFT_683902 [Peniophora sp. CONT]
MSNASVNQETGNLLSAAAPLIHRLPNDVFCEIFRVWADIDHPAPDSLGFIRGSHVCQLWRAVMLDLPTLWADIICTYRVASAVKTFLKRARDAPLVLDFGERHARKMVEMLVAKDALSRARVIVCMWLKISMVDWGSLLSTQALLPNLRTLKIGRGAPTSIFLVTEEGRVDIVSAPSLEELHLRKIRLTVNAPTLRFLTLEVLFPDVSPSSTAASTSNLPELLQTVALYPMLERLTLMIDGWGADRHANFEAPPVLGSPISLSHLRQLTMRGRPATLTLILKNLDVPQHAAVSCDLP